VTDIGRRVSGDGFQVDFVDEVDCMEIAETPSSHPSPSRGEGVGSAYEGA